MSLFFYVQRFNDKKDIVYFDTKPFRPQRFKSPQLFILQVQNTVVNNVEFGFNLKTLSLLF